MMSFLTTCIKKGMPDYSVDISPQVNLCYSWYIKLKKNIFRRKDIIVTWLFITPNFICLSTHQTSHKSRCIFSSQPSYFISISQFFIVCLALQLNLLISLNNVKHVLTMERAVTGQEYLKKLQCNHQQHYTWTLKQEAYCYPVRSVSLQKKARPNI